jgi:hypothetical protein
MAEIAFAIFNLPSNEAEIVRQVNAALARLSSRRQQRVDTHFNQSKHAWYLAVLQEAILYRIVALGRGAALAWNAENLPTTFLAARALVETIVLAEYINDKLEDLIKNEDLEGIGKLLLHQATSTRNETWLTDAPDAKATNVLTLLNRFDTKVLPGVHRLFDILSERCHPNYLGHWEMFATVDTAAGMAIFSDAKRLDRDRKAMLPAFLLLLLFEKNLNALSAKAAQIAEMDLRKRQGVPTEPKE